jgi:LPXTG-motif cell wall-anchored protein
VLEGNGHTKTSGFAFLESNNSGWGFGGLALAGSLIISRRKKNEAHT